MFGRVVRVTISARERALHDRIQRIGVRRRKRRQRLMDRFIVEFWRGGAFA